MAKENSLGTGPHSHVSRVRSDELLQSLDGSVADAPRLPVCSSVSYLRQDAQLHTDVGRQ